MSFYTGAHDVSSEVESPSGDFSERLESYALEHAREEQIRSGGLISQPTPRQQQHSGGGGQQMPAYKYPETRQGYFLDYL